MAEAYWNSTRKCFSIKERGRVINHLALFHIDNPTFHVAPGARDRVRRTRKKEVHATIRGEPRVAATLDLPPTARRVVYNPHINDQSVEHATNKPVLAGTTAFFRVVNNHPEVFVL